MIRLVLFAAVGAFALAAGAIADDWNNSGKNSHRDGLSAEFGPDAPELLWSGGRETMLAWPAFIEGHRLFTIRQLDWPSAAPQDAFVVAMDINTGQELWAKEIPFFADDWLPWIGGVMNGKVFVSRSGNGGEARSPLFAYSAETGNILWASDDDIEAGCYDGMVFAPDGDPVIGSATEVRRIDAVDGSTVWRSERACPISGHCGAAIYGRGVYIIDVDFGGQILVRFDLATGAYSYAGGSMSGLLMQNTPMCGPDGTIYVSRTQNNPSVDYFYAFEDTGSGITQKWRVPAAWTPCSEFGIGPDGSVYMFKPGFELVRLDPADGSELNSAGYLATPDFLVPRFAIDAAGRVYLSNGSYEDGRLYSFNADLSLRWQTPVTDIHVGGPSLGPGGTLVVCGVGTDMRAYRTPRGDLNCDGDINAFDIDPFVLALTDPQAYGAMYPTCDASYADMNADGAVNAFDIDPFVQVLTGA